MIIATNEDQIAFVAIGLLVAMVLAWFVMLSKLFRRLSDHHPAKYEAMGRPTLFLRTTSPRD